MSNSSKHSLLSSIVVPSRMVFIMWLLFVLQLKFQFNLLYLGIMPRTAKGAIGILTSPFIHLSYYHIISNTLPMLVLGSMLFYFYPRRANSVFWRCFIFTNILVWIFGRQAYHIGASGLIYAIATFLILAGFFNKDFRSLVIAVLVILVYGSIFSNLIPASPMVSWEAHLMGAVTGGVTAYQMRKRQY